MSSLQPDCAFCGNLIDVVLYEDDRCLVVLHDDWSVRGHAMVVWRAHVENVSDLSDADLQHFIRVHARAERAPLEATGAERAILLKLGIQTPHLHLHIYPVSATADRAEVMRAIDGEVHVEKDDSLVEELQRRLR